MHCPECEHIDAHIFDETNFWLTMPTVDSAAKTVTWLSMNGYKTSRFGRRGIHIIMKRGRVDRFITGLYGEINGQELASARIVTTDGGEPGPQDIDRVMTGEMFVNRYIADWLVDSVEQNRYESWFQPIVHAPEAEIFGHEALFRLYDDSGRIVSPAHVFSLADKAGLLFTVDLIARRSAVECAATVRPEGKLFINFNPSSIYDPTYCLRTTAAAIQELCISPEDIVFEITETHQARDKAHLEGILSYYRDAGFGVALDDVGSGYSGLKLLLELQPDYAKIDMDLIRGIDQDKSKQTLVAGIIGVSQRIGIKTIAEGIETEAEAGWLREAGADYMQGYYFGKPQSMAESQAAQ